MIRNLKVLGLLAFAALAMSAMFASSASAQEKGTLTTGHTENEKGEVEHTPATLIGEQYPHPQTSEEDKHEWETWNFFKATPEDPDADAIRCDTATLTGTTDTGTETEIKVQPHYTHCIVKGQPATVNMNGCEYLLTQPETFVGGNPEEYTGKVDLTCPVIEGVHQEIEIDVFGFGNSTNTSHFFKACTITIGPAEGSEEVEGHTVDPLDGHIIYKNIEGKDTATKELDTDDITALVEVEGITSDSSECPEGNHHDNGIYTSTVTIEAFEDEPEKHDNQIDAWISDPTSGD